MEHTKGDEMTDLDKLEAAIDAFTAIKRHAITGTVLAVYGECGKKRYDVRMEQYDEVIKAARAHLAAQRQGGDADESERARFIRMRRTIEYLRDEQERLYEIFDVPAEKHEGKFRFDTLVARAVDMKAKAHPPAVTGDRGALEAFESLFRVDDVEDDGEGWIRPVNYDQCRPLLAAEYETIRAALLSAQAGVPGDVVDAVKRLNDIRHADNARGMKGGFVPDRTDAAIYDLVNTLSPYLNTNDGRE